MVTRSRRVMLAVVVSSFFLGVQSTNAQALDESFRADIEKLLEITGSAELGTQIASLMSQQLLANLKKSQPSMPEEMLDIAQQVLDEEFAKAFAEPEGLTSQVVSIYAKHFTHADVQGLLEFYSSDLGRKVIGVLPSVVQESAQAGQQWAAERAPTIRAALERRLKAEGLTK